MDTKLPAKPTIKSPPVHAAPGVQPDFRADKRRQDTPTSDANAAQAAQRHAGGLGGRASSYRPSRLVPTTRTNTDTAPATPATSLPEGDQGRVGAPTDLAERAQLKSTDNGLNFLVEQADPKFRIPALMELRANDAISQTPLVRDLGDEPVAWHSDDNSLPMEVDPFDSDALMSDREHNQTPVVCDFGDELVAGYGDVDSSPMDVDAFDSDALMSDGEHSAFMDDGTPAPNMSAQTQRQKILDSIAQSVLVTQTKANAMLAQHDSAVAFTRAIKQITRDTVRFVETQAEAAKNPRSSLAEVQDAERKCHVGKEAVLELTAAYDQQNVAAIQNSVKNAIRGASQSPVEAVFEVAAPVINLALTHADLEPVTIAKVAAASVTVEFATRAALELDPANRQQIAYAVLSTLGQSTQGQFVTQMLAGIRDGSLSIHGI